MEVKEFLRKHLLKIFLVFILVQLGIFALVQNLNHRPKALSDEIDVIEGRSAKISPVANDVDKDEKDILYLSDISSPKHGSAEQKGNFIFYTPNKDFTGKDSLTYTVTDGKKESKPKSIVIRVIKNLAPVANHDKAVVYSGGTAVIYALGNDRDQEKDSMFISETTKPSYGVLKVSENQFYYTARNAAPMEDSFYYTVSDGKHRSQRASVKIKIQNKTGSCYPWLALDIGDVSKPGVISCDNNSLKIKAFGSDIWNNSDGFYFLFQMISGDCEISARIDSLEGPHEWTKSGLMIRENLSATSRNVFIGLTTKNGITTQARPENLGSSETGERKSDLKAPYWIKLNREDNTFSFAISPDGINWEKMEGVPQKMAENVYVGVAVTSHDNNGICKTVLSNYKLIGKPVVFKKP